MGKQVKLSKAQEFALMIVFNYQGWRYQGEEWESTRAWKGIQRPTVNIVTQRHLIEWRSRGFIEYPHPTHEGYGELDRMGVLEQFCRDMGYEPYCKSEPENAISVEPIAADDNTMTAAEAVDNSAQAILKEFEAADDAAWDNKEERLDRTEWLLNQIVELREDLAHKEFELRSTEEELRKVRWEIVGKGVHCSGDYAVEVLQEQRAIAQRQLAFEKARADKAEANNKTAQAVAKQVFAGNHEIGEAVVILATALGMPHPELVSVDKVLANFKERFQALQLAAKAAAEDYARLKAAARHVIETVDDHSAASVNEVLDAAAELGKLLNGDGK